MGIAEFATEFTEGSEDGAAGRFSLLLPSPERKDHFSTSRQPRHSVVVNYVAEIPGF
jgi:hypothetical protein